MNRAPKRVQRRIALSTEWTLEDRLLQSTIGRSMTAAVAAEVGSLTSGKSEMVRRAQEEERPAYHGVHPLIDHSATKVPATAGRWSWLANTYWYVPTSNVMATLSNSATGKVSSISDQTVFHITNYRGGYFWGDVAVQYGPSTPVSAFLIGSVTPAGKVLLNFTYTSSSSTTSITTGYGTMERRFGQWSMVNQMFTSPSDTTQIGHWAYMMQTKPSQRSWYSLPAVNVSVPEFFSEANGGG